MTMLRSDKRVQTAGNWNPDSDPIYFLAANISALERTQELSRHRLIAINEIKGEAEDVVRWIDQGCDVLIDSGVFALAQEHAKRHGVTHDEGLRMAPAEIDGFDALLEKWCRIIDLIGDRCWGYIEIDQGGAENKRVTRKRLEDMGYRPIPVYHPYLDGWDYFDELASGYDRICLGNIVQAPQPERRAILATIWERKQQYPDLWIHGLGLTPNHLAMSYPLNSCDSSSWMRSLMFPLGTGTNYFGGMSLGHLDIGFNYRRGDMGAEVGADAAGRVLGFQGQMVTRTWRTHVQALKEIGVEPWPATR